MDDCYEGQVRINKQRVYYTQELGNGVVVTFTHQELALSGMVSINARLDNYVTSYQNRRKRIDVFSYKISYLKLDLFLEFIKKSIPESKLSHLQVCVISNYYSEYFFQVCRCLKEQGIAISRAHFPKMVWESFTGFRKYYDSRVIDFKNKSFYSKANITYVIDRLALDSRSGNLITYFRWALNFTHKIPETIPIPQVEPVSSYIGKINLSPTRTSDMFYNSQKVHKYKSRLKSIFPNLSPLSFVETLGDLSASAIVKVDTKDFVYQTLKNYPRVYVTSGVWDCVAIIMTNPTYHLSLLSHELWEPSKIYNPTLFPHLNRIFEEFDAKLPNEYKTSTKVTLISYYISKNLIYLTQYLKDKGFIVSQISHYDVLIKRGGNIYLDPTTVYHENSYNYDRKTGRRLKARKVAVNQDGQICENWKGCVKFQRRIIA